MVRDQRRLAAIVSADVAGYSRLMGRDDSGTLAVLKGHRRELIDPKIAEYGGRIVKTTGDGLLLEFPSIVDAVRCAVDVQRGMAERNADVLREQQIEFRIGVNVGDIIIDGDDIYGDGVNVAARLQVLAEPGGICASRVVRDQVLDKLSFAFEDLGPQQVKNIARPVEAYRVSLGSDTLQTPSSGRKRLQRLARAFGWRWLVAGALVLGIVGLLARALPQLWQPTMSFSAMSVAIAPLVAPHGDAEASVFAEEFGRDLASRLGRVGGTVGRVRVITAKLDAPSGGSIDPRELGRSLKVRYVLEGNALREGNSNTANLRLVDTGSGRQVWSERVTLQVAETKGDSSVILRGLSRRLRTALLGAEKQRVMALPLSRLSPEELLLRATALSDLDHSLAGTLKARKLVEDALHLDPNLEAALLYRTDLAFDELALDPHADLNRIAHEANEYTGRAVILNPTDPWAWNFRALALLTLGRWDAALEANALATNLDADEPRFYGNRALLMNFMGRPEEGLVLAGRALAMDPTDAGDATLWACQSYVLLGQAERAVATCEKASVLMPGGLIMQALLVAAYADHGDAGKAAAAKAELLRTVPGYTIAQARAADEPVNPEYDKLAQRYYYEGLRKAGIPEN